MERSKPSKLSASQEADLARLIALLKAAPGVQALVAEDLGVTPATVSQQATGYRPLNLRTAAAFARRLNVPLSDISPFLAQRAVEMGNNNVTMTVGRSRKIPLISYVQAGNWMEATDGYSVGQGSEMLDVDFPCSERTFALEIKGESMLPDYVEGDRIIVDPDVVPQPGDFVVAKNSEECATFKKFRPRGLGVNGEQVFELVPLNPDYPSMRSDREPIVVIGVVVEHRRRMRR
jgi:SOS-response transcriptional repressor LexA